MSSLHLVRRFLFAATAAGMAVAVAACGSSSGGGPSSATLAASATNGGKLTKVSVQAFPQTLGDIPIQVAQQQGFFKKNGLDVTLTPGAAGPAMIAAVASGQVDAVGIPMPVGLQSLKAGANVRAAVGLIGGGGSVVFVSSRVPATTAPYPASAKGLQGRTVAISAPGGFSDRMLRYFLGKAGVSANYATLPGVAPETAAMQAGRVDAVNFDLASSYKLQKQGLGRILWDFQTTGPSDLRGVSTNELWVSSSFATQHPQEAQALAKSIAQADAWIKSNQSQAAKYFTQVAGSPVTGPALAAMVNAMDPVVGTKDIQAYTPLLGGNPPATSDVVASSAPQDPAAAQTLAGGA
ncbi:MAG: ABC transporter substrate-binding protein [Candidatus Dormibacteria bacterium]